MRHLIIILFFLLPISTYAQTGIGTTTPDPSAQLEVSSTSKGFLPPRMTTEQRDAIIDPAVGLQIYNITTKTLEYKTESGWGSLISNPDGVNAGEMQYWDGSTWAVIETTVNEGATLKMIGGVPTWVGGTPPLTAPDAPTIETAIGGYAQATVTFTAPANNGGAAITTYTVTSFPGGITKTGASSPITITGLTNGTAYTFTVTATNSVGPGAASAASNSVTPVAPSITTVTSSTGKIWMDRNLGATRVATSSTDTDAYGDLYQWGRGTDGHQKRTSGTTGVQSSSTSPGTTFITGSNWYSGTAPDNLWQGVNGINNPCPSGYRLPTGPEWNAELETWSSINAAGAIASPLKLPMAGSRLYSDGSLVGTFGGYWSSTVSNAGFSWSSTESQYFRLIGISTIYRGNGFSVRCLKEEATAPDSPKIGTATGGGTQATVTFTAPVSDGGAAITIYTVTSSPGGITATGAGSPITITGLTNGTAYTFSVTATNSVGTGAPSAASSSVTPAAAAVSTVTSSTGLIWMDRNLGATQVATSSTDTDAYGDLYQWGRGTDGHQKRTSGSTGVQSSSTSPGTTFITGSTNWYSGTDPDNLWQGVNGINNPCPSGYRLPTEAEWNAERATWSSNNAAGAIASPLKLPMAGYRYFNGSLQGVGAGGWYWSSTVSSSSTVSRNLHFSSSNAGMLTNYRANGYAVRCLKEATAPDAPTIGTATGGDTQARVAFTAPVSVGGGAITTYTVTSSPGGITATGASSSITITGLTNGTAYTFSVTATNSGGTGAASAASNSVTPATVPSVTNLNTGKIWMDRNLGATQVATSSTDAAAYGDLYQWGRGTDGHQKRTSGTTTVQSSSTSPGTTFITITYINENGLWYIGTDPDPDNLWQGVNGINNPCPSGYRLPTNAEWEAERATWSSNDAAGAIASPLKLPMAGNRHPEYGSLVNIGSNTGLYWSSTFNNRATGSQTLTFAAWGNATMFSNNRATGQSVRCLKD